MHLIHLKLFNNRASVRYSLPSAEPTLKAKMDRFESDQEIMNELEQLSDAVLLKT